MARFLVFFVAAGLLVACTSDSTTQQQQLPPESATQVGGIQPIFDVIPSDEFDSFSDDERYLVSLLVSPVGLDDSYKLHVVNVDDPNGGAAIGDRWYEPRLRVEDCSFATDQAPMPVVEGGYIPGDPNDSTTKNPFGVIDAPYQLGTRIQLFDTSEQRDSFAAVMRQAFVAKRDLDCGISDLFGTTEEFTPGDIGYPAYGFMETSTTGAGGEGFTIQSLIGDRVLLTSSLGNPGFGEGPDDDLDVALLEPFIERQIAILLASGLG